SLQQGRLPDRRAAGRQQEGGHRRLGQGRRRQRKIAVIAPPAPCRGGGAGLIGGSTKLMAATTARDLPRRRRRASLPLSWVGVPLSFAFIATLGRLGLMTVVLRDWFGVNLYATGFNLISFSGLALTYLYFQVPLMVLIITPALDGLKREWREAAECLGASGG